MGKPFTITLYDDETDVTHTMEVVESTEGFRATVRHTLRPVAAGQPATPVVLSVALGQLTDMEDPGPFYLHLSDWVGSLHRALQGEIT